jgi:uncharacterized membrane protein (DUF485 family)
MPRKKPDELKSNGGPGKVAPVTSPAPAAPAPAPVAAPAPAAAPQVEVQAQMTVDKGTMLDGADLNGDGHISKEEMEMHLEFKRKELEDADAMRDAQRQMAWFALFGMLLYPFSVVLASYFDLTNAASVLGSMAATYFVSVAAIVMAFFGAQAYKGKSNSK